MTAPDLPRPFDADATWICVPRGDRDEVVRTLRLRTVLEANWRSGLGYARSEGVFVSPPVDGAVFAVGRDLARHATDPSRVRELLESLSQRFGTAYWFSTDQVRDVHGWAIAEGGELVRSYAYYEEHGHLFSHGELTAAERELGCFVDDPRDSSLDEIKWWPDRDVVRALARTWTIDPQSLVPGGGPPALGCLGRL